MSRSWLAEARELFRAPQDRWLLFLLAATSFTSILYQTAISQEFSASISWFRAGLQIVFGLVHLFYGLGMYLAYRIFRSSFSMGAFRAVLVLTGFAVAFSLLFAFRMGVSTTAGLAFVWMASGLVAASLTFFGMIYAAVLVWFHDRDRRTMGLVVAVGLVGLVLAFVLRSFLVIHVGNNLILVLIAASCVLFALGPRPSWLNGVLLALALLFPSLDGKMEALRDIRGRFDRFSYQDYLPPSEVLTFRPLINQWSPYAKINLYEVPGTPRMGGAYNYYITWIFDGVKDGRRELAYGFIEPDDKVLVIAIGGGWPLLAIPVADRSQITGVELDPVVVEFFQEHPEHNDNLFNQIRLIRSEGRAALDTLDEVFDAIVVDLPGSPATQKENPIEFENYLLTEEAFHRAFSLLPEDGVMVVYLLAHQIGPAWATLDKMGIPLQVLFSPSPTPQHASYRFRNETYVLYASRSQARVDAIAQAVLARSPATGERFTEVPDSFKSTVTFGRSDTDDRPFSQFLSYLEGKLTRESSTGAVDIAMKASKVSSAITILVSVAILLFAGRGRQRLHYLFFFAIGAGYVLFQLYLYARLRTYFGDPISTTLLSTLLLFASGTVGSLFTNKVADAELGALWRVGATGLLLVLTHVGLGILPFGADSLLVKLLAAAVVITPFGFISGLFFPLGLRKVTNQELGWALALDATGTFLGFLGFYFLSWYVGISYNVWPILACYLLAALVIGRRSA